MSIPIFFLLVALAIIMMVAIHNLGSDSLAIQILSLAIVLAIVIVVATIPAWYVR